MVRGGGGIWTSADSGATWTHRTAAGNRDWYSIASSSDGTKLAAVERVRWTTTGIYTSDDSGATWTPRSIYGGGNWVSIASSSDGTKLAAVMEVYVWGSDWGSANYRYQYYGVLCTSDDSGATWTHRMAAGIRRKWYSIASSSDGTKLAAVVFGGSIYTSDDSGATWRNSSR